MPDHLDNDPEAKIDIDPEAEGVRSRRVELVLSLISVPWEDRPREQITTLLGDNDFLASLGLWDPVEIHLDPADIDIHHFLDTLREELIDFPIELGAEDPQLESPDFEDNQALEVLELVCQYQNVHPTDIRHVVEQSLTVGLTCLQHAYQWLRYICALGGRETGGHDLSNEILLVRDIDEYLLHTPFENLPPEFQKHFVDKVGILYSSRNPRSDSPLGPSKDYLVTVLVDSALEVLAHAAQSRTLPGEKASSILPTECPDLLDMYTDLLTCRLGGS